MLARDPVTVERIDEAQAVSNALADDRAPPALVVVDGEHAEGAAAIALVNIAARRPPVWILAEPAARAHTAAWPAHDGYLALSTSAWMLRAHLVGLLTERSVIGAVLPVRKLRGAPREPDAPPTDARERHEAARSASEERLRLIARASGDVVWDWDLRNDTIWWSENYAEVFGHRYDRDAPSSLSWSQYIHPDDYARVMNDVEHAIAQGAERWSAYDRLRHVDGR